ncbi:insulin-like growth factor-binding protein-related protein 1 [Adelges cooleyi]|uniref:insulin-like growth factor-binding protein-related protein 1 n=1 Tax=Adelges cooleyi TaxID=133065 RepID=UPI00217F3B26|nr:insulin-like growth factor-binding protein-related protein 1 [Adelges cooleyi]
MDNGRAATLATTIIVTILAVFAISAASVKRSDPQCPDDGCTAVQCPRGQEACLLGLVPDGCECCPYGVCGLGEGLECGTSKPCANNLECTKMEDSKTVYQCVCKENEMVCGSDNTTYTNVCQLNEASAKQGYNGSLWMQYWGPCHKAPTFKSIPKNVAGTIGQPVVFDCEIKGFPVPSVSWQFRDTSGATRSLPGDDTAIAIQTRGGPDRLTVTSWVQIMYFKPNHAGNYSCTGISSEGIAMSSATLDIMKMV